MISPSSPSSLIRAISSGFAAMKAVGSALQQTAVLRPGFNHAAQTGLLFEQSMRNSRPCKVIGGREAGDSAADDDDVLWHALNQFAHRLKPVPPRLCHPLPAPDLRWHRL